MRKALSKGAPGDPLRLRDGDTVREAWLTDESLDRVLYLTTDGVLPPRDWLTDLLARPVLSVQDRGLLLIGRGLDAAADTSPVVCACRGVRAAKIAAAAAAGAADVDAIGEVTTAGAVCGSCRPEIARLLAAANRPEIANAA